MNDPRKWFSLQYNDEKQQQQKHIRFKTKQTLKKMQFHESIHVFLTYRSYLSVTEKSSTYDFSFPQASISENNSVSLNLLKGLCLAAIQQNL